MTLTPFALSGLLIVLSCTVMAALVYFANRRSVANRLWARFCCSVSLWGFGALGIGLGVPHDVALIIIRFSYIGVILIPALFHHFVTVFLGLKRPNSLFLVYAVTVFFEIVNWTPWLVPRMQWVFGQFYFPVPGPFYPYFFCFFMGMTIFSHIEMLVILRRTEHGLVRLRIKWFLVAMVIGYAGGTSCFLPVFGVPLYPLGNFSVPLYPIITTYAILRYQIMDVNLAMARGFAFLFTYSLVIGLPFFVGHRYQTLWKQLLGSSWWTAPVALMGTLSSLGPSVYLWLQKRAESRLLRDQQRYQATLLHASAGMTRIRDVRRLCHLIVHLITHSVKASHAGLFLLDRNIRAYVLKASRQHPRYTPGRWVSADVPLAQMLRDSRKPVVIDELRLHTTATDRSYRELFRFLEEFQVSVGVPIFIEHRLLGFILLGPKRPRDIYTAADLEALSTLANQAALAIENAMVFEELAKTQAEVIEQESRATVDALSGLYTRRAFVERARLALQRAARRGLSCSLLMLDLDHFKNTNDTHGHLAGDAVIQEVANRLRTTLREPDLLGRFGGDEFILLLVESPRPQALAIAERIREAVSGSPLQTPEGTLPQTLSIGLASSPEDGVGLDALIVKADQALYAAKHAGRNRVSSTPDDVPPG